MENIRVRAIIPLDGGIIFIHRIKNIDNEVIEYYPLPGGGVESGETVEDGLLREIKEELGLTVNIIKPLYKLNEEASTQYIYLCEYKEGKFGTGEGPEFNDKAYAESGKYIPAIIRLEDLNKMDIVPLEFKEQLLIDLSDNKLEDISFKEIRVVKRI